MTADSNVGAGRDGLPTAFIRLRVSQQDVHYGGGIVAGAKMMEYFGDVATELCIRYDGDEGLMAAYDLVEFKRPVHAGDFLEVRGRITDVGRRSRKVEMEAYKVIEGDWQHGTSAAAVLPEPVLVARATGTVVAPKKS
jgi:3-aminobutyryl-CoA ammonia-lyase